MVNFIFLRSLQIIADNREVHFEPLLTFAMLLLMLLFVMLYIIISNVFFRYPHLIHKRKSPHCIPVHISHRGGSGESIENTMEAFRKYAGALIIVTCSAVSGGTDMLELDCHITKDGEVVILHDSDLDRSTGVNANISNLHYDELPLYLAELEVQFDPGNYYEAVSGTDRRIPRLEELFTAFPSTPMNIDIKVDDDRLIARVAELVHRFKREKYTVWGSFSTTVSAKCKQANPDIPRFFPLTPVLWLFAGYVFGFLPFMSLSYDYLELPLISTFALQMRRQLYQHLKARGIPVIFWVCNTFEDYKKVFDIGAQGVMTDYPTRLRAFLQGRRSNAISYDCAQLTNSTVQKPIGQKRNRRRSGRCFIKNSLASHLAGDYTFLKPPNVASH
ncbi:lysophospholipase D [Paragonimus westermani]|uniref:Lysophospholipase D n=1 Tax=Paragonimus westermani TaxID=34504 RepID=A0A5J4P329_9TREM|nr:lysophospholipase D [Paragonimus westermani]